MRVRPVAAKAALTCSVLLAGVSPALHAQGGEPAAPALERIVITAEKRVTVLDTTPASITVLGGSGFTEQGASGLADIANLSPNTSFTTGQGASQLFVRGIGNVFFFAGGDPGVAPYSDGSYVSDQTSSNLGLFDMQRIELLRGPQGALYGRNATAGAVNLISAAPTAAWSARAGLVLGSQGRQELDGHLSGPVGGGTRLRLAWQARELDGWTHNTLAGQVSRPVPGSATTATAPDRLDDLSTRALRLQTLTEVGNGGSLRLIATHQRERDAGPSMPLLRDPVMVSLLLHGVLPGDDPRVVKSQQSSNRVDVDSLQALAQQALGSATLRATASWRRSRVDRSFDADATEAATAHSRLSTASIDRSVDVHLASDGAPLQWLVGVTWLGFEQRQGYDIATLLPLGFVVPGAPLTLPLGEGTTGLLGGVVRTRSAAAYADLRWAWSPQWSLLAGLRVNRDRKAADEYLDIAGLGVQGRASLADAWTSTPASLGLEWKPAADRLAWLRLAHGFKSGAVNLGSLQGQMVKPEKSLSLEIGFKAGFRQRRGSLSATLFSTDYRDMQVARVGQVTPVLANAAKARIHGAEFELALRPDAAWLLAAGIGLMRPTYTAFVNTDLRNDPTRAVDLRGRQLAQVSKAQAVLSAEYAPPLGGWRPTLRAEIGWRSRIYFTEFNTADATQASHALVNLSASLQGAGGHWRVHAWLRNATDKAAITSMTIGSPLVGAARQVTWTPPRLFGVGASLVF